MPKVASSGKFPDNFLNNFKSSNFEIFSQNLVAIAYMRLAINFILKFIFLFTPGMNYKYVEAIIATAIWLISIL